MIEGSILTDCLWRQRLIEYGKDFNQGQGIGFVMFGVTVNKRTLGVFFGGTIALVSVLAKLITVLGAASQEAQLQELTAEVAAMHRSEAVLTEELNVLLLAANGTTSG